MIPQSKINKSISLLQKAEKLALRYNPDGFYLAFSGGKDSQCIYELAKMGGVKFKAYYHVTTLDHPELMRFIKQNYKDVIWERPEMTFFQLCRKMKMLPTRMARFCCKYLKEGGGAGMVCITGVRKAESNKRALRNEIEIDKHKFSGSIDQFNSAFHSNEDGTFVQCISGNDKIIVNPIIDWTDSDVWSFIKQVRNIPYCSLYDKGYNRLGCLMCPMASVKDRIKMQNDYPHIRKSWIRLIEQIKKESNNDKSIFSMTPEEAYEAWMHDMGKKLYEQQKKQLKLKFEEK